MKTITIPFDRIKLCLSTMLYLFLFMMMPALCLYVSLDPLMIFFLLTICWFMLKGALRNIKRLIKKKPICECDHQEIRIHSLTSNTITMKCKDIERVVVKEKRHGIQFLIYGKHIQHASGVYMIHIDYPFCTKQLNDVKQSLFDYFEKQHITVEIFQSVNKEAHANV